jgi:hypothetical protein
MPSENKLLTNKFQNTAANTPEIVYTNGNTLDTMITAFTAVNETATARKYKVYIVDSGGAVNRAVVPQTTLSRGTGGVVDKIIGQMVPAGGTLQVETDSAASIHFTVSGREFTT